MKITIDGWHRGLWIAGPPSKTPQGSLTRMINVQVQDEGTVATRPGCALYLALANTVDGAYASNQHFYKDINQEIFYQDGTDLGFTQTHHPRHMHCEGMTTFGLPTDPVYFASAMKKYYNGVVSNWGISVEPAAPTAAVTGSAGNLTGDYTYRLAFYNSITKTVGALSDISNSVNLTGGQVNLTGITAACTDPQANMVRIFRTQGGISGIYYYVTDIPLGTVVYADNMADTGLGDPINNYQISPPAGNIASKYKSRILLMDIVGNPRYLYPSAGSQPELFASNLFEMVADSGDTVEGAITNGDYSYVFGQQSIYIVQVTDDDIIYLAKLPAARGTFNGNTISMSVNGIYYASDDGIYVMSGFTATKISDNIDALFRGTDRGGMALIADTHMCSGDFIGGRYYFTYFGTDGQWHTAIFNELKGRWKHYTGWLYTVQPTSGSYPLVGLPNNIGLYSTPTSLTDDAGQSYTSLCGFNLGMPTTALLDIRHFRLSARCAGDLTIDFYDDTTLKYSVVLNGLTFNDGYLKYSLPLGTYFTQPEVVISSNVPFTLKMFEADVNFVRKYEADFTRQPNLSGAQPQGLS